ncbi:MAG: DUF11 domain-containing protein [Phycisphaerae bacterium]
MKTKLTVLSVLVCAGLWMAAGCTSYYHKVLTLPGGAIAREHGKPMEGGYYSNFDPAAIELEVLPIESTNPVRTQHVLIATVKDKDGKPLSMRRVEWMIAEGSVGTIVEVDESGYKSMRGYKVDNKYAVTHTNMGDHILKGSAEDMSDAVQIKKGQTWCVITSPIEGDTHMVVYAPGIFDWKHHKVFPVKHWRDAKWEWPAEATNPVGTPHDLVVKVMKASDGSPMEGCIVNFTIMDGPDAKFAPDGGKVVSAKTDAAGTAKVTLTQVSPVEGVNTIGMEILKPPCNPCEPTARLAKGSTTKTWIAPKIEITKTAPETAGINEEFTYDITVTNPGKAPATNTLVTDILPEGIAYVSSDPAATVAGQELKWNLGTLAAEQSQKLTVRVKSTKTGKFENCASVTADMGLSAKACAPTEIKAAALKLEKTGPAEVLLCDTITYKIVVTNTGDGPATNVKIVDNLPDGLTSEGNQTVSIDGGTIPAGQSVESTFNAKASKAGTFENKSVATADNGLTAEATHKLVVKQPVLSLTKTGPEKRYLGRKAAFEITVTNKGDIEARDTVVVDMLPEGLEFVSASDNGQLKDGQVVWQLGTLAPNDTKKLTIETKALTKGTFKNAAKATAACAEATADASVVIEGIPGILLEMWDTEDPIEVGATETYVITVTNQGSAEDTNIRITCTIPDEEEFVSCSGVTNGNGEGKTVTFEPLPKLDPKVKAEWRVVVKAVKAGDVRFKVEMISDMLTTKTPVMKTESTHLYE